jgi:hypothetical protein
MLKRAPRSEQSHLVTLRGAALLVLLAIGVSSCDRGAGAQIAAARKFTHAVVTGNTNERDSMVATSLFREHINNQYTYAEMIRWMQSFYDIGQRKFKTASSADVDADLSDDLGGGLVVPGKIEETGLVHVNSPIKGEQHAYFWMVKQENLPWRVAMVTKGEMKVHFK